MVIYTYKATESLVKGKTIFTGGKEVLLWVIMEEFPIMKCRVTIKGFYNPLPFTKLVTSEKEANRINHWLRQQGWEFIGATRTQFQ